MVLKHQHVSDGDVYNLVHLDDDPLELKSFARVLKNNHLNVTFNIFSFLSIHDFKIGVKKISKIDFAILDIFLSDEASQTGISVVQELKHDHPNIIILMSSNLDDPDSVLQSLRAGADEFLSKKVDKSDIVEKILQVKKLAFLKSGLNIQDKKYFSLLF